MPTIYERLKKAGVPLDNHASDLYAKDTVATREIIADYEFPQNIRPFRSQIDGELWLEIPFAYDLYWDEKIKEQSK